MDNKIYEIKTNPFYSCCVCFSDHKIIFNNQTNEVLSLQDIDKKWFDNEIIPDDLLIKNSCNIHYICISCLRKITHNYESHMINETESHIYCPFPFEKCQNELGFRYIFEHSHIQKICRSEKEWENYINYTSEYEFPGFTKIKCPSLFYYKGQNIVCNSDILIETEEFKSKPIGELILSCDQNINCLKRCCYNCKKPISFYSNICYTCATTYENENPNVLNYFLNKTEKILDNPTTSKALDEFDLESPSKYSPEDYLYYNHEITEDIALLQLKQVIDNYELYMICPICKISLFKTEKCNGLSHHNIERCYVCGRIGYKIKGLGDHWSPNGESGCFRFESDSFVRYTLPHYHCSDLTCHNHDIGECQIPEHQKGIEDLDNLRKSSTILHIINSLLPNIRYSVYDKIHEYCKENSEKYILLPFKQTLLLLDKFKIHSRHCTEKVIYYELKLKYPNYETKIETVECNDYIIANSLIEESNESETNIIPSINQIRIWRENLDGELQPLLRRRRRLIESFLPSIDFPINESESENEMEIETEIERDVTEYTPISDNVSENVSDNNESIDYHFINTTDSRNLIDEIIDHYNRFSNLNVPENEENLNENLETSDNDE